MTLIRDILQLVRSVAGVRNKMASVEDTDLIDLGNGVCVPRVTISDCTLEEQEHLLDVCPPKLEQKLSLTRKEEHRRSENDNGDVLVTLGHDQVVPARKRIDVVSSDTIKRVRDITKNLEPVIRKSSSSGISEIYSSDTVDHPGDSSTSSSGSQKFVEGPKDDTYEAQEISNAFNFLEEHEDNEDKNDTGYNLQDELFDSDLSLYSSSSPMQLGSYRGSSECSRKFDLEMVECGSLQSRGKGSTEYNGSLDNPAFEVSPSSKNYSSDSPVRIRSVSVSFDFERPRRTASLKRRSEEDGRGSKRRSLRRFHRKSWTEGVFFENGGKDALATSDGIESGLGIYKRESPNSERAQMQMGFFAGSPPEVKSGSTTEDGCSECSDVDWSWLEEVECLRAAEGTSSAAATTAAANIANERAEREGVRTPTNGSAARRRATDRRADDSSRSVAMSVIATGKSLAVGGSQWPHTALHVNNNSANEDDEATRCNATNETVDRENRDSHGAGNAITNSSWVRASMRRLRHLRLPEGTERQRTAESANRRAALVSAPNSLPDIALIAPEILAAQTNGTSNTLLRPSSAPVRNANNNTNVAGTPRRGGRQFTGNRSRGTRSRDLSSRQNSVVSTTTVSDTTISGTTTCSSSFGGGSTSPPSSTATSPQRTTSRRVCDRQRDVDRDDDRGEDDDEDENPLGRWPHALSPALACLGCTLGMFNISRFSILSIQFGANFIVQFLILSLILGIPLFTLQVCIGQRLASGSLDMWKISPLFQGVGIALLTAQALIGIYSIVGVSWMFVYFRDSFITKQDRYRWAEPFLLYREDSRPTYNSSTSYKLHETVPDYFSGAVLQRHHLNEPDPGVITLKFQVAFNLAVVWMIVFVSLSKGLRSYGKVVYVFTLVPVSGTLVLCTKLLGLTPLGSIHQLFPATVWTEFFINGKSWVAASNEVFLTWGLLGSAAMQIAAHNKHKHLLQRDTSLVIVLTFVVLLLAAFLANTCVQILRHYGYIYTTSSFEKISGYTFMRLVNQPAPAGHSSTPERFMTHASFLVGQRVTRPSVDLSSESGYQVLRLATELVPATLALLGTEQVSPFWAVLFYFILILFGIAQQLAIWHCVITGIMAINTKMMKLWETTITFFSCACAYILGLPMATELGIYVVYYLDYIVGGAWWIMVLYLVQVGAVFAVRGRPHTGEDIVAELFPSTGRCLRHWAGPLLAFTWNVVLPVTLMVLSITVFKSGGFRELYTYRRSSKDYWAVWARQLGASIQLIPILMIPAVAVIQTCRYLNSGPPDIFDRIQLLYRPPLEPEDPQDAQTQIRNDTSTSIHGNGILPATTDVPFEDPPPKYTPPPSYTTATGARIAKMLRQSFRRSVRRIANVLGESSAPRQRPALQPPPPDYATVLVEMNQSEQASDITINVTDLRVDVANPPRNNQSNVAERHRPNTIDRMTRISTIDRCTIERTHSTLDRGRRPCTNSSLPASSLTAADVANLLRSSIRRGTARTQQSLRRSFCQDEPTTAASVENLVEAAAPIGQDSLVLAKDTFLVPNQQANDDSDHKKTADEMESSVSVI